MKNLKKRLPVLILAFLIAVTPFGMAVPGYANSPFTNSDPLEGADHLLFGASFTADESSISGFLPGTYWFFAPAVLVDDFDLNKYNYYLSFHHSIFSGDDLVKVELIISDSSVFPSFSDGHVSFPLTSSLSYYYYFVPVSEFVPGTFVHDWYDDSGVSFSYSPQGFFYLTGTGWVPSVDSSDLVVDSCLLQWSSSYGVLTVFSGISSWFVNAVNHMIPIFWSVEAGLTPIGVLSVCSLALAVFFLLFWLLVCFLKLK